MALETAAAGKRFAGYTGFSYRRFSSSKQTSGDSFDRQMKQAREVALTLGCQLDETLKLDDAAVSSFKGANLDPNVGTLGAFIELAKSKQIPKKSILIIEHLDRFSRAGIAKALPVFMGLLECGVTIYSVIESTIYEPKDRNELGKMIQAVVSFAAANDFSAKLSNRVSSARQKLLAQAAEGKLVNLGSKVPSWFKWNGSKYEPSEHFNTVKRIYRDYLAGKSRFEIEKDLTADKVPTFRAKHWNSASIFHVLTSETTKGWLNGKPYFGLQAVSEETWQKVQGMLTVNKQRRGRKASKVNFLKGLLVCATCGGRMNIVENRPNKAGRRIRYVRCSNHTFGRCDCEHTANADQVEFSVMSSLRLNVDSLTIDNHETEKKNLAALEEKEKQLTKRIALLMDAEIDLEDLKVKLSSLKSEREQVRSAIAVTKDSIPVNGNYNFAIEKIEDIVGSTLKTVRFFDGIKTAVSDNEKRTQLAKVLPQLIKSVKVDLNTYEQSLDFKSGVTSAAVCFYDKETGISEGLDHETGIVWGQLPILNP